MSEFACKQGHLMSSRDLFCPVCAEQGLFHEGVYTMDGMTSSELNRREKWEDDRARRDDDEQEEN